MIKKFVYIFIPVLAVLFMSHNVFAVDSVWDMSGYTPRNVGVRFNMNCNVNGVTQEDSNFCSINGKKQIYTLLTQENIRANKGDIVELDLVFFQPLGDSFDIPKLSLVTVQTPSNAFTVLGYKDVTSFYSSDIETGSVYDRVYVSKVIRFTFYVFSDYVGRFGIQSSNTYYPLFLIEGDFSLKYINGINYSLKGTQVNNEQKEATQEAANNSATSGSNSSSNSQTATSSLLSVITSGIGAITSASPTNCKINGNMGNLNVGNIDLCANPVPTFMALIGSIIAVLVVLPLVILLFNRFISIIRSFQR